MKTTTNPKYLPMTYPIETETKRAKAWRSDRIEFWNNLLIDDPPKINNLIETPIPHIENPQITLTNVWIKTFETMPPLIHQNNTISYYNITENNTIEIKTETIISPEPWELYRVI